MHVACLVGSSVNHAGLRMRVLVWRVLRQDLILLRIAARLCFGHRSAHK